MIWIVFKFLTPKGFRGITLYPFVFMKDSKDKQNRVFRNHERIHARQQLELLLVLFYFWYGLEFLIRLWQFKNRREAYYNISLEREAYQNEKDLDYLKKRSFWSFVQYL